MASSTKSTPADDGSDHAAGDVAERDADDAQQGAGDHQACEQAAGVGGEVVDVVGGQFGGGGQAH